MSISRRQLLLAGAASGAAALGAGGAVLSGASAEVVVSPDPAEPARLSAARKVVVIGGGLAGLSAAIELAERGFETTLLEAGDACGGRVGAWSAQVGDETQQVEHGFHAFFTHYYTLRDLIRRACDPDDFIDVGSYPVACAGRPMDQLSPSKAPFPLNLIGVALASNNLSIPELLPGGAHVLEFVRYHPERTYERLDGISFKSWCEEVGVAPSLFEVFYRPFARALFNPLEELSAAEMIRLFHGYFTGNPEGLGFQVARRPSSESLIAPLVAHFQRAGGTLRLNKGARGLAFEGDALVGVLVDAEGAPQRVGALPLAALPDEGFARLDSDIGPVYVRKEGDGAVALSARCTHQGCPVLWDAAQDGFACPCHGGRYNSAGQPVAGPPKAPLATLQTRVEPDGVAVYATSHSAEQLLAADHVVLAVDVPGVKQIAASTRWPDALTPFAQTLDTACVTKPYVVSRFWVDTPTDDGRAPLYTTAGYTYLDVLAVFDAFQEPSKQWASAHRGAVVEAHAYALTPEQAADPEAVADALWADVTEILTELKGAKVLHREIQRLNNFPAYGVGSHAARPGVETPVPNLSLAGDWVRTELPAALMERAAVTGRLAANRVLAAEGVRQVEVRSVPTTGLLA